MFTINDANELTALHNAVLEAKFHPAPTDGDIAGSPVLAGVSNRLYDELSKAHHDARAVTSTDYQEMRRIKLKKGYRGQWRTAVIAARRDPLMKSASPEERLSLAKCYLSPFTSKEGELRAFLDEVDGKTGEHDLGKLFKENDFGSAKLLDAAYSFDKKQAHCVFMLKDMRVCDIYFSGVRSFSLDYGKYDGSDIPDMPVMKKHNVTSGTVQSLEASFDGADGKISLSVTAFNVDIWL